MTTARINGRHATAIVAAVCVAIVLAPLVAQAGGPASRTTRVKGTVNVGNFPATQNVGGTVNVGNLPSTQHVDGTVNVGNLPPTQNVAGGVTANPGFPGTPFTQQAFVTTGADSASITVPSGKHLVIETVSAYVVVTTGSPVLGRLDYSSNGTGASLYIPMTYVQTISGADYLDATMPVDLYVDPSSTVTFYGFVFNGGSQFTVSLTVSGYLT